MLQIQHFVIPFCLLMGVELTYAAEEPPIQVGKLRLNETVPREFSREKDHPYSEFYILPNAVSVAADQLLRRPESNLSGYFLAYDGRLAEIVLDFRDPNYKILRRKLVDIYGMGLQKNIDGESVCNDIATTTWIGKESTLVLAVIRPDAKSGTALAAQLSLRSKDLYGRFYKRFLKAYEKFDPPECSHQKW